MPKAVTIDNKIAKYGRSNPGFSLEVEMVELPEVPDNLTKIEEYLKSRHNGLW